MARYFFDTFDGEMVRDRVGLDCATLDEVKVQALLGLADLVRETVRTSQNSSMSVRVKDRNGVQVLSVSLELNVNATP